MTRSSPTCWRTTAWKQDNGRTIEEVAGHAEAVKFTLVKKITQG